MRQFSFNPYVVYQEKVVYLHPLRFMIRRIFHITCVILSVVILSAGVSSCSSSRSVHKRAHRKEHVKRHRKTDDRQKDKDSRKEIRERMEIERRLVRDILSKSEVSEERRKVIEEAAEWLGTRYEYGSQEKGESTDCSGLIMQVFLKAVEMKLPRNSARQADFCKTLKNKDRQGGDLVFFATGSDPERVTHVGLMIDEVNFIHASSSKGVVISRMDNSWYIKRFLKYGRIPGLK